MCRLVCAALHPVHLALVSSQWKVLGDADFAVAQQTKASITLVNAWKAGSNYAWIHAHTFDAKGNQRATQLCFRQADGTLERAPASRFPKSAAFEENDPALAKKIAALPFYRSLPWGEPDS